MIYERKYHNVEVRLITHSGTFSTRAGMVQGSSGDVLTYDPDKAVYVKGENPRDNAHNWDLVKKADFEKDYVEVGEHLVGGQPEAQLSPAPTDFGVHQFDENGIFLGYKSQKDLDAEAEAAENARLEVEAAKAEEDRRQKAEAKRLSDIEEGKKLDAENAKLKKAAEGNPTAPIAPHVTEPIKPQ